MAERPVLPMCSTLRQDRMRNRAAFTEKSARRKNRTARKWRELTARIAAVFIGVWTLGTFGLLRLNLYVGDVFVGAFVTTREFPGGYLSPPINAFISRSTSASLDWNT